MEPTWLNIIYIRVCVFDTCGFHMDMFINPQSKNNSGNRLKNINHLWVAFVWNTYYYIRYKKLHQPLSGNPIFVKLN